MAVAKPSRPPMWGFPPAPDVVRLVCAGPSWPRSPGPLGLPQRTGIERLVHPGVGELRLAYETLVLPDADDQRLVVYLPADDATSAALDRLTGRQPGALRAVTG